MHGLGDVRLTGDVDISTILCNNLNILVPMKPVIKYPLCSLRRELNRICSDRMGFLLAGLILSRMNQLIHNNLNSGIMGQAWSKRDLLIIMEKQKTLVYTNEELSTHEQKEDNSVLLTCVTILQLESESKIFDLCHQRFKLWTIYSWLLCKGSKLLNAILWET